MTHFGEIVESNPLSWKTHSWKWEIYPALGSIVIAHNAENIAIFGIVAYIETGSMDPARHPFPYQKNDVELRREQPQIFAFLQTICTCITLGYQENSILYCQLPPYPPRIHTFVRPATKEEVLQLITQTGFLHLMLNNAGQPSISRDELALALLKQLADHELLTREYLEEFVTISSGITGNDYRKLKLFLERAEYLLQRKRPPNDSRAVTHAQ